MKQMLDIQYTKCLQNMEVGLSTGRKMVLEFRRNENKELVENNNSMSLGSPQ